MTPRLHYFERVDSTMDVIHEMAAGGAESGTAVLAGEQLGGRGSRGRQWHSPPGGLWLSLLFRPSALGGIEIISLRVGLAVAGAIEPRLAGPVLIKWPNDLMLGDRKVGGILCEARWQGSALGWIAVGIGLNVSNVIPSDLGGTAVALAEEQPGMTREDVVEPILAAARQVDLAADHLTPGELERFNSRDWLLGREIRTPVAGTAAGLRNDGALLVRTPDGAEIPLRSGSIELAAVSHTR
jgi:BirA family biotin operon repressor/biotin-[acetyl-CoA-carboxylase] ligase